jgi:hypothetical protein
MHVPCVHVVGDAQSPQLVVTPQSSVKLPQLRPSVAQLVVCMKHGGSVQAETVSTVLKIRGKYGFDRSADARALRARCGGCAVAAAGCSSTIVGEVATAEPSACTGRGLKAKTSVMAHV